ncbi:hypothetical protein [Ascidiimonas aurantiaca]|uniref:hypothetical protein n=1 Tax=Ascidiimonas aurantiaca TaxID=1685432 RepID=UPI0030EF924D
MIRNNLLFRFIVLWFVLWLFPFPLGSIPYLDVVAQFIEKGITTLVLWFGNDVLSLSNEVNSVTTGSGDKLYDYVRLLCVVLIAVLGTFLWIFFQRGSAFENKKEKINYWFLIYLRYYLAVVMLGYGFAKVFVLQFQEPGFVRLITNFGDFSPMGVVWSFMGQSKAYTIFSGALEVIGGLLLLHRRTTLLGASLVLLVMGNIMALNFFYDIPVKLYSVRYFLIALLIMLPDMRSLAKVIFGFGSTTARVIQRPFETRKWYPATRIIKWVAVITFVVYSVYTTYGSMQTYGLLAPKPELYGLYEVNEYLRNGDRVPPLLTDSTRLRYIAIDRSTFATLFDMKKNKTYYRMSRDSITRKLSLVNYQDSTDVYTLSVIVNDSLYTFKGLHKKDTIELKTQRYGKEDFLLNQRKFKWIQERPYNR